ncbi:major capsid protein [Nocardiopsis terrae]|uniref:HK97 family phage major capsid protein n=1 Tax=Nocardiopsis terrae TaxID=372655 RepID=A0ABR9HJE7_9ACTN|nr:phage major capsid protein [Nocardiopsis terrae]MBE1459124.1 HK97 family phage major capsid protein [Nocardiopsis terrae]GHC88275.1 major capsid protein [Nocardiopsis terrae]
MSRRDEITQRMHEITARTGEIGSYKNPTRAQGREADALLAEFADLAQERRELDLERVRSLNAKGSSESGVSHYDPDHASSRRTRTPGDTLRDQARRELERSHDSGHMPDHAATTVDRLIARDGSAHSQTHTARWLLATGSDSYARAFAKKCADPLHGHLLWEADEAEAWRTAELFRTEQRAMSLTDSAGGHLIPAHLDPAITLTSDGSINPLRAISRNVTVAGDTWNGVTSAGVTAEWKAEAAEAADASPTLTQPSIPVHLGDAFVPFSFEVGMDAPGFMDELGKLLADGLDQLHATAFTTGTGTGQPTGIITALVGTASELSPETAETFASDDVYAVQNALPPRFSANAQWCAEISTINSAAQFETGNGARLFPEINDGRLLRKPLDELSNMDAVANIDTGATADNRILLYGDFSNYVIVTRIGSTMELIPNLVGANQRPTGQRGALLWARTGADSVNDNAFRMLNVATTA